MKHEFSLASKLAAMEVGHVLYMDDDDPVREGKMTPTKMERQVTNIVTKNTKLTGRKFKTTRAAAMNFAARTLSPLLRIERTA